MGEPKRKTFSASVKITAGEPTISIKGIVVDRDPPVKPPRPPWHRRFVDQNLSLAKRLKLKEIARECGKQAVWEIGKWWLGRKRQPPKLAET